MPDNRRNSFLQFKSKYPNMSRSGGSARQRLAQAQAQSRNQIRVAPRMKGLGQAQYYGAAVTSSAMYAEQGIPSEDEIEELMNSMGNRELAEKLGVAKELYFKADNQSDDAVLKGILQEARQQGPTEQDKLRQNILARTKDLRRQLAIQKQDTPGYNNATSYAQSKLAAIDNPTERQAQYEAFEPIIKDRIKNDLIAAHEVEHGEDWQYSKDDPAVKAGIRFTTQGYLPTRQEINEEYDRRAIEQYDQNGIGADFYRPDGSVKDLEWDNEKRRMAAVKEAEEKGFLDSTIAKMYGADAFALIARGGKQLHGYLKENAPIYGQSVNSISNLFDDLDVFSQTSAETIGSGVQLVKGGWRPSNWENPEWRENLVPTLFQEGASEMVGEEGTIPGWNWRNRAGYQDALKKFDEGSLVSQIMKGFLDPFILVAAPIKGTKMAIKHGPKLYKHLTMSKGTKKIKAGRKIMDEKKRQAIAEAQPLPVLSTKSEIISRVTPRISGAAAGIAGVKGIRQVLELADPSIALPSLKEGSIEKAAVEARLTHAAHVEEINAHVSNLMAVVRTKGDIEVEFGMESAKNKWGIGKKEQPDPRASKIDRFQEPGQRPRNAKGHFMPQNPYFGMIAERPDDYRLFPKQREMIDYFHKLEADMLTMMRAEGVDIKELGSMDEGFQYFSREVRSKTKQKGSVHGPATGSSKKSRIHADMEELDTTSQRYLGPLDALEVYLRRGYTDIANKRLADELLEFEIKKDTMDWITGQKNALTRADRAMRKAQQLVRNSKGIQAGLPHGSSINAAIRAFPELSEQLKEVLTFSPASVKGIVNEVSSVHAENLKAVLEPAQIERAIIEAQESLGYNMTGMGNVNDKQYAAMQLFIHKQADVSAMERAHVAKTGIAPLTKAERRIIFKNVEKGKYAEKNTELWNNLLKNRGYDEAQIKQLTELKKLSLNVKKAGTGIQNKHLFAAAANQGAMPDDVGGVIDVAMKKLGLQGAKANQLSKALKQAAYKEMIKTRKAALDNIQGQMDELYKQKAAANSLEKKRLTDLKANSVRRRSYEDNLPSLGPLMWGHVFDSENAAVINKVFDDFLPPEERGIRKIWGAATTTADIMRTLRTTIDFGTMFIHGLPTLMLDPGRWAKVTATSMHALADPMVRARYVRDNVADITDYVKHGGNIGSVEYFDSLKEGGWLASLPLKLADATDVGDRARTAIAVGPQAIVYSGQRFGNSFEMWLDAARIETWKSMRHLATDQKTSNDLAVFVNQLTGAVNTKALGVPTTQREIESTIMFFAPRYMRATAGLFMDVASGGIRGKYARKTLGRVFAGMSLAHLAVARSLGQEPNFDWSKQGEFLTVEIAGQKVRMGGKSFSFMNSLTKVVEKGMEDPEGFLSWDTFDAQTYRDNPIMSTLRNQGAPLSGTALSFAIGADPMGKAVPEFHEPVNIMKWLAEDNLPFWAQAATEAMAAERAVSNPSLVPAMTAAALEGTGLTTFAMSTRNRYNKLLDKYSREEYNLPWEKVKEASNFNGAEEKRALTRAHPDLAEYERAMVKEQGNFVLYRQRLNVDISQKRIKAEWMTGLNQAADNFDNQTNGSDSWKVLSQEIKKLGTAKRAKLEELKAQHPEVYQELKEYQDQMADDFPAQTAMTEYFERIGNFTDDDEFGAVNRQTKQIDYDAIEDIQEDIDDKYGEGTWDKIEQNMIDGRAEMVTPDGEPIELRSRIVEWFNSWNVLEGYYKAYETVLPKEEWDDWSDYAKASDTRKTQIKSNRRDLNWRLLEAKVKRAQDRMIRQNPEMDRALVLFRGHSPKSTEVIMELRQIYVDGILGQREI